MIERRPTERLVTADDLPDRDMWFDPEELYPYMDAQDAAIEQLQREQDTRCQQYEERLSDLAGKLGEAKALLRRAVIVINHAVDMGHMPMTQSEIDWIVDLSREMIGDIRKMLHPTTGGQDE